MPRIVKAPTRSGNKWCTKCDLELPYASFGADKQRRDGLKTACKECLNLHSRQYRNTPEGKSSVEAYRRSPEAKAKRRVSPYVKSQARKDYSARYMREKRKKDPVFRMRAAVSVGVFDALAGRTKKSGTFDILGYSLADLKSHMESLFLPGMTWANYGAAWWIDHIVPQSKFGPDQVKECWQLANLWPMWKHINQLKSSNEDFILPDDWMETPEYAKEALNARD